MGKVKAFLKKIWSLIGLAFGIAVTAVKWLDKRFPLWIMTNAAWGSLAGGAIWAILSANIGHSASVEALHAAGGTIAAPFAALAPILSIGIGIAIFAWLTFWDVWSIKKYGSR